MAEAGAIVTLAIGIAVVFTLPEVTDDSREPLVTGHRVVTVHDAIDHHPLLAVVPREAIIAVTLRLVTYPVVVAVVLTCQLIAQFSRELTETSACPVVA